MKIRIAPETRIYRETPQSNSDFDIEKSYQILEFYGVPRERAESVHNGIDVLVTRLKRENDMLRFEISELEKLS